MKRLEVIFVITLWLKLVALAVTIKVTLRLHWKR